VPDDPDEKDRPMVRFLHAADLHLGLRVTRFDEVVCQRVGEARFVALQKLRQRAAELRVDFVLVAGDVFDDHSVSRSEAARAFPILESSPGSCPVFIIPGNHDPLVPGGVWDRDPWLRDQPHLRVHFLRKPEPVNVPNLPVTIFPCPVRQRRSMDDPTAWIENHPRADGDTKIRIGLAHGSLNIMRLPDDDHLIRPDAVDYYGLDYLALGHWHKRLLHKSSDGLERTAYCGTHEPMAFPGGNASLSTGWMSYSADSEAERFQDSGDGIALLVEIEATNAPPRIEPVHVGHLRWRAEQQDVTGMSLGSLIKEYSQRDNPELTLLRLTLSGVMDPQAYARLEELRGIVQHRYHPGSSLDANGVLIEPDAEQLAETVGAGVLKRVLERLKDDVHSTDLGTRRTAEHALKLLYRIASEEQPS
jgi:DNA repair exonuclease SbcCD nuclease subunit